jgi:RNA polymerase sigma-70 factor, ECF subfamily
LTSSDKFDGVLLAKQGRAQLKASRETAEIGQNVSNESASAISAAPSLALLSDEHLMARIGNGDEHAYSALVTRHLGPCTGLATKVLSHQSDAEEVMQEAFIRLWRHAPSWKVDGAKFTTWFYRVIVNLCIDHQRKVKRRPQSAMSIGPGDANQNSPMQRQFADDHEAADQQIERQQTTIEIHAALERLPSRQRTAITLCYFQELSNKEAAEIMDINIKALESLLTRGRKGLAARMGHLRSEGKTS